MKHLPSLCLLFAVLLSGCSSAHTVSVVNEREFKLMGCRLTPELSKRGVIGSDGSYRTPFFKDAFPSPVGKTLFERLSPNFLLPSGQHARSFAEISQPDDAIAFLDDGFAIKDSESTITVRLLGAADWNQDGKKDWFVLCRREVGFSWIDYYLVIDRMDTTPFGVERIGTGKPSTDKAYYRSAVVRGIGHSELKGKFKRQSFGELEEVKAGSRTVIPSPSKARVENPSGGLVEHSLSK